MTAQRFRIVSLILPGIAILMVFNLWSKPLPAETLTMNFASSTSRGTLEANGTYVFYSRGSEVTSQFLLPPEAVNAKIFSVEFPLETQDGSTVYGMFYVYGVIADDSFTNKAFHQDGEYRWVVTTFVPQALRASLEAQVNQVPKAAFTNESAVDYIRSAVLSDMEPIWKKIQFYPQVVSIFVYPASQ